MSAIRSRLARLEREIIATDSEPLVVIVRTVVAEDGTYTGQELRWDSDSGVWASTYNPDLAGKPARAAQGNVARRRARGRT